MEYGPRHFTSSTNALSTNDEEILVARASRVSALILNTDNTITVYVGAEGVDSTGFPLRAGASMTTTTTASVWAVAASGTPTIAIFEEWN